MFFLREDKHQHLLQAGSIVLLVITRHAQSTQNSKSVTSLQYLKKERRDEVDFLHAGKYQIILQVDTINRGVHGQSYPKYPK